MKMAEEYAYIYFLQDGTDKGTNIYKIGRTKQASDTRKLSRLQCYSKGTIVRNTYIVSVRQLLQIEDRIKTLFKEKYRLVRGAEWFEGNALWMKEDIDAIINEFAKLPEYDEKYVNIQEQCINQIKKTKKIKKPIVNEMTDAAIEPLTPQPDPQGPLLKATIKGENKVTQAIKLFTQVPHAFVDDFCGVYNDKDVTKCYNEFNINLDVVAKWLNTCKAILLKTLRDSYIENVDYTKKSAPNKKYKQGGNRNLLVMLTTDCMKRLCMRSRTEGAKFIQSYFVQIEHILIKAHQPSNPLFSLLQETPADALSLTSVECELIQEAERDS